jgi:hypothetical protein
VGYSEPTGHHLTEWNEITLSVVDAKLDGTASARVKWSYNEEDVGEDGVEILELTLLADASSATAAIEAELLPWDHHTTRIRRRVSDALQAEVLPWAAAKVMVSRPTPGIAPHLVLPAGWTAVDVVEDGHGIREALVSFTGDWDEVGGQEVSLSLRDDLIDLSGTPVSFAAMSISVLDVGPAQLAHDMSSADTVATSGGEIEAYVEGECADTGCLKLDAFCNERAMVAGQLLLDGQSEITVRMRKDTVTEYPEDPSFYRVALIAEDGTRLDPKVGGTWDWENPEQAWVYDAAGHSKVGFSVATTDYCHGWGGPLILDEVSAQ